MVVVEFGWCQIVCGGGGKRWKLLGVCDSRGGVQPAGLHGQNLNVPPRDEVEQRGPGSKSWSSKTQHILQTVNLVPLGVVAAVKCCLW